MYTELKVELCELRLRSNPRRPFRPDLSRPRANTPSRDGD